MILNTIIKGIVEYANPSKSFDFEGFFVLELIGIHIVFYFNF